MKVSKTHFEQIPVETVKRIAKELSNVIDIDDVTTESQDEVASLPQKRWREMAQKVELEKDPQKMIKLVEELIAAFDEEERRRSGNDLSIATCNAGPASVPDLSNQPSPLSQLGSEKATVLLD
jgi:hypothetical protein